MLYDLVLAKASMEVGMVVDGEVHRTNSGEVNKLVGDSNLVKISGTNKVGINNLVPLAGINSRVYHKHGINSNNGSNLSKVNGQTNSTSNGDNNHRF